MRRIALALLLALPAALAGQAAAPTAPEPALDSTGILRMRADVEHLASRELEGRQAGSRGGEAAALFLALRFAELGLSGPYGAVCGEAARCAAGYFQTLDGAEGGARNVIARVPGTGPGGRYLVVGAHFDHIGWGSFGAMDRERGPAIHRGADDNASGTALMLELARRFAERPARQGVVFIGFDAEEYGMVGSSWYVRHAPYPVDSARFMLNLDMVGRMSGDRLYVEMGSLGPHRDRLRSVLDSAAAPTGLRLSPTAQIASRSDHASFRAERVPAIALFTGFHPQYHTALDVPSRINFEGMARIADFAEAVIRREADGA
jgi:hypothetical protein